VLDRVSDAGAELRTARVASGLREERAVDLLDVDAVVDRLNTGGELKELARSGFRVGEGAALRSCAQRIRGGATRAFLTQEVFHRPDAEAKHCCRVWYMQSAEAPRPPPTTHG
jgi:hypothetical protein